MYNSDKAQDIKPQTNWQIYSFINKMTDCSSDGYTRESFFDRKGSLIGIEEETPLGNTQYHYTSYIEASQFVQVQNKKPNSTECKGTLIKKDYLKGCTDSYFEYTIKDDDKHAMAGELLLQYGNQYAYYTKDPDKKGYDFVRFKEDENGNCIIIEFSQNETKQDYIAERGDCPFDFRQSDYVCYFENGKIVKYRTDASIGRILSLNNISTEGQF